MIGNIPIENEDQALVLAAALDLFQESIQVSKINMEHLIENNGKPDFPNYEAPIVENLKEEINNADITLKALNILISSNAKLLVETPTVAPKPNAKG